MKNIQLSKGKVALVDDEDFDFLSQWRWHFSTGYAMRTSPRSEGKKAILMHREINKTPQYMETDHINHDKLDNRKNNLRNATKSENAMNRKFYSGTTSIFKGVSKPRGRDKWQATIKINRQSLYLGQFDCEIEAAKRYDDAAEFYFGDFAKTNFNRTTGGATNETE